MSKKAMPRVFLDVGETNTSSPYRERTPLFIFVSQASSTGIYSFRIAFDFEGVNKETDELADFWFEHLKIAAATDEDTKVSIRMLWETDDGLYNECKHYTGRLCKQDSTAPRVCPENPDLFEFDLCDVTASESCYVELPSD